MGPSGRQVVGDFEQWRQNLVQEAPEGQGQGQGQEGLETVSETGWGPAAGVFVQSLRERREPDEDRVAGNSWAESPREAGGPETEQQSERRREPQAAAAGAELVGPGSSWLAFSGGVGGDGTL